MLCIKPCSLPILCVILFSCTLKWRWWQGLRHDLYVYTVCILWRTGSLVLAFNYQAEHSLFFCNLVSVNQTEWWIIPACPIPSIVMCLLFSLGLPLSLSFFFYKGSIEETNSSEMCICMSVLVLFSVDWFFWFFCWTWETVYIYNIYYILI